MVLLSTCVCRSVCRDGCELDQHFIARVMTVGIVNVLEQVDIDHNKSQVFFWCRQIIAVFAAQFRQFWLDKFVFDFSTGANAI
jgi:hypothetical protein